MATLAAQNVNRAGRTPTYAAASGGGDRFIPGGDVFLHVKNGGGSSITVTVAATEKVHGDISVANEVVTVAAGTDKMFGPFPAGAYLAGDGSGLADITYSAVTTVTVAALKLAR